MSKQITKKESGWAISGQWTRRRFLYVGWWRTRKDAIGSHSKDKGRTWEKCREMGDRLEKVIVSWRENP